MFKKIYFMLLFYFFLFFSFLIFSDKMLVWSIPFNYFFSNNFLNFSFSWVLDRFSISFFCMVLFVTTLVVLYSQVYMEHYNNKKFLFLLLLFFLSMGMISLSDSFLVLMIGWDGLGVSSICLIMFYPNKMTLYNSLLTMFINRLGDVLLILVLSFILLNFFNSFFLIDQSLFLTFLLLLCSFTKSAQFPVSAWLPAAMSAPTPISAMVHSSTLVTAGIFLMHKMFFYLNWWSLSSMLAYFSFLSFFLGGLMANLESDLKKMVAFSTMSQISMILVFIALSLPFLAMAHMVSHALFKTLLFCCSGLMFLSLYSTQQFKSFGLKISTNFVVSMYFLSIYSMSGLMFSSSFYTKDLSLELLNYEGMFSSFFVLIGGSLATLLYCSKMMNSSFSFPNLWATLQNKNFNFSSLWMFSISTLLGGEFLKTVLWCDMAPIISSFELILILSLLIFPTLMVVHTTNFYAFFFSLTLEVSFSKIFSFSFWKNLYSGYPRQVGLSDSLFLKFSNISVSKLSLINKSSHFIIFFFLALMAYFYS